MAINSARELIDSSKKNPENFYIIHYSCQSLFDDNESLSPRITSIAIVHFGSDQIVSFSTHAIAEELGIARDSVIARFDEIEKRLLDSFYEFIRDRRDKFWIHWNMRDQTYGFEHIEHRHRVLGSANAPVIPVERRINLSDMISDRYGSDFASHPKMLNLMELNGGRHRYFLTGAEEVSSFKDCEFIRLHQSTLCKAGFFARALRKMNSGKLHTKSNKIGVKIDRILESRGAKTTALISSIVGLPSAAYAIITFF